MRIIFYLAVSLTVFLPAKLCGDIAYSNLGPNDEFSTQLPFLIGRFNDQAPNVELAFRFTSEATGFVSSVDVGVGLSSSGQDDSMLVALWTNVNNLPGVEIWSGTLKPRFVTEVLSATSSDPGMTELIEGERYWVSARSQNTTGRYLWYRNSTGATSRTVTDFTGTGNWMNPSNFTQTAFRVNLGAAIPEPTSGALLVPLAVGLLLGRRRKRRIVQS